MVLGAVAVACGWCGGDGWSQDEKWAIYDAALGKTAEHLPTLNAALAELEGLIHSEVGGAGGCVCGVGGGPGGGG